MRGVVTIVGVAILGALSACAGCGSTRATEAERRDAVVRNASPAVADAKQLLVVLGGGESRFVRVWFLQRDQREGDKGLVCTGYRVDSPSAWRVVRGPMDGVVGARGFAPRGEKREGDRRTPTGAFTITESFGTEARGDLRLPYRVLTARDVWCEDPDSPDYNRWIVVDERASGVERMTDDPRLFRLGAVIDYNRSPVVPGAGSGIFLHFAEPKGAGTYGCVGLDTPDLEAVMKLLDPTLRPMVLMGRGEELESK